MLKILSSRKTWFGVGVFMLSMFAPRILDSIQVTLPIPNLVINLIGAGVGALFILWGALGRSKGVVISETNNIAWVVYDALEVAFGDLMHTVDERERANIFSRIRKERGKLPDSGLDEIINPFLDAEAEEKRYGLPPYGDIQEKVLDPVCERMRKYIKRKYGGRG